MKANYEYPLDYFLNKLNLTDGVFVDVGANDGIKGSMTYDLEQKGWKGILVEPNPILVENLKKVRTSPVFACAISSSEGDMPFYIVEGPDNLHGLSRFDYSKDFDEHIKKCGGTIEKKIVHVRKISNVIKEAATLFKIDFLKIDVEGHELEVLKSFDFETYHPQLIVTEDNFKDEDKSVRNFLASKGYAVIARDRINYWFAPKKSVSKFLYDAYHAKMRFLRWDAKRMLLGLAKKKMKTGNN